jgi:hypothetical protein
MEELGELLAGLRIRSNAILSTGGHRRRTRLDREDLIVGFRPDGRSLLATRDWEMPGRIESVQLATGQRTLLREIAPDNTIGAIEFGGVDLSEDENSHVYSIARCVGALFSVEGAR